MVTLNMVNQYALDNGLGDDTDIFTILSQMQLEYTDTFKRVAEKVSPSASGMDYLNKVEYSTQDVLNLFNT